VVSWVTFRSFCGSFAIPAGMGDTEFLRSDELTRRTATGYLPIEGRQNEAVPSPVVGTQRGGSTSTGRADISSFWTVLVRRADRLSRSGLPKMVRPAQLTCPPAQAYGLGVWLPSHRRRAAGIDAGVSFRTSPTTRVPRLTHTVLSNISAGRGRSPPASTLLVRDCGPLRRDPCYSSDTAMSILMRWGAWVSALQADLGLMLLIPRCGEFVLYRARCVCVADKAEATE